MYGLTLVNEKIMIDKALSKKNGCYSFRGGIYKVDNFHITHFATNKGEVIERCSGFNVGIGNFEGGIGWETRAKKILKELK